MKAAGASIIGVTPDGKIAETIGGLAPAENVERALAAIQSLQK